MAVKFKWGRTLNAFDTSVKIVPSEENSKSNAENKTEKKNAVKNTTVNKKENALPGHTISSDKTANINKGKRLARNSKVTASRSNNFKSRAERIGLDINDYYYDVGRYGLDAANKNFEKKLNSGETKYKAEQAKKNNEFLRLKNTEYYAKRDNILRQYQSQILSDRNAADVTAKGRNNPNNRIINNISKMPSVSTRGFVDNPDFGKVREISSGVPVKYATEDEINTYSYWLEVSPDKANEYFDALSTVLNNRKAQDVKTKSKEFAEQHPVGATLSTPIKGLFAGAEGFLNIAGQNISEKTGGHYLPAKELANKNTLLNEVNTARQTVEDSIDNPVGKFLYGVGTSTLDNIVGMAVYQGAYPVMMAMNAAGGSAHESLERGLEKNQAMLNGVVGGTIEYMTEKLFFDDVMDMVTHPLRKDSLSKVKDFSAAMLKSAGSEFGEETVGGLAQNIADTVIAGDKSKFNMLLDKYVEDGYNKDEAARMAFFECYIKEPLQNGLAGAISGSAIGSGGAYINQTLVTGKGNEVINSNFGDEFLTAALGADKSTETAIIADKINNKLANGERVTDYEYGRLALAMQNDGVKLSDDVLKEGYIHKTKNVHLKEGGGVAGTVSASRLNNATYRLIDNFGKANGKNFIITDAVTVKDENGIDVEIGANGFVDTKNPNIVYLNANATRALYTVAKHEITHTIENTKGYEAYSKYVLERIKTNPEAYSKAIAEYQRRYDEQVRKYNPEMARMTRAEAEKELVADISWKFNNSFSEVAKLAKEQPGTAQKIANAYRTLRAKMQGVFEDADNNADFAFDTMTAQEIEKANRLWNEALGTSIVGNGGGQVRNITDVLHRPRERKYSTKSPGSILNDITSDIITVGNMSYPELKTLDENLTTRDNRVNEGEFTYAYTWDNFYLCQKTGKQEYKIIEVIDSDADYELILIIKRGLTDGTFRSTESVARMVEEYKSRQGQYYRDNAYVEEARAYRENARLSSGEQRSERTNDNKKSPRNQKGNEQVKNITDVLHKPGEEKYSLAGENAKTADKKALEKAKGLEADGADAETIYKQTGWHRGRDSKWRYEINDSESVFSKRGVFTNPDLNRYKDLEERFINGTISDAEQNELRHLVQNLEGVRKTPKYLSEVLVHDELYEAYPELKDVKVMFGNTKNGTKGVYNPRYNTVLISNKLTNEQAKSTLLHEVQHMIQNREGFAGGSSIEYWEQNKGDSERTAQDLYQNTAGEIEARETQNRMNMTADERRNNMPYTGDENTVFADSDESYSIVNIKGKNGDYGEGVLLDTNIFDGKKPREWNKVLTEFVYNNLAGTEITVRDENGNEEVISFAKRNERVQKDGAANSHKVIDKLARAKGNISSLGIVHIDELLQTASTFSTEQENSHQWLDDNGWEYRNTYLQDINGNIYITTLNIAKTRDGRKILYALSNTKKVDDGVVSSTQKREGLAHNDQLSDNSIPQNPDVVNTNSEKSTGIRYDLQDISKEDRNEIANRANIFKGTYNSKVNAKELSEAIGEVYGMMKDLNNDLPDEEFMENVRAVQSVAEKAAKMVLDSAVVTYGETWENAKSMRGFIANQTFRVQPDIDKKFPAGGYNSYEEFRKANFNKITTSKTSGTYVDSLYYELAGRYPEYFDGTKYKTAEEQLVHIADVLEKTKPKERGMSTEEYNTEVQILTAEIMELCSNGAPSEGKQKLSKVYSNSIQKSAYKQIQSVAETRKAEFMYDGITNKETYQAAQEAVQSLGITEATMDFLTRANSDGKWTAEDTAEGLYLMSYYQSHNDAKRAVDIASAMQKQLTRAGQAIQAMRIIDKLTPEGKFIMLTREAQKINNSAEEKLRERARGNRKLADELEKIDELKNNKKSKNDVPDITEVMKKTDDTTASEDYSKKQTQKEVPGNTDEPGKKEHSVKWDDKNNVPDITGVMKKPGEKSNFVPDSGGEQQSIPGTEPETLIEQLYDKYKIPYIPRKTLEELGNRFNQIEFLKTPEQLIDLIMKQSKERRTVHNNSLRKTLEKQDVKLLKDIASKQIFGMLKDEVKRSVAQKLGTYQTIAQLLNARTMGRNIISNWVFNEFATVTYDIGNLFDMFIGVFTKQNTVGIDRGHFEKGHVKAQKENAQHKYIDIALDVETFSENETKYDEDLKKPGRVFTKGPLSKAERWMSYGLTVTDEWSKGGIEYNIYNALGRIKNNPFTEEEMREIAEEEAKYRTFQDENIISKVMGSLKRTFNIIGFGEKGVQGPHQFGAGDLIIKYTQVPGALISRGIEFSPVGYMKSLYVLCNAAKEKSFTPKMQRDLALSLARATTGTGLICLFAFLSSLGVIIKNDDEDKELKEFKKAEGVSGLQINLSAMLRLFDGKFEPDIIDGDKLMSIGFFEPINSIMSKGIELSRGSITDKKTWENIILSKTWDEIADMSTMYTLRTILDASQGSGDMNGVLLGIAGDAVAGFIPSPVKQLAQTIDTTERNPYGTKEPVDKIKHKVMSGIPGLSKNVPPKITPLGELKSNDTGNVVTNILNNFVSPGYLNVYQPGEVSKELYKLSKYNADALTRIAPNSFKVDEEEVKIDSKEYARWAQMLGGRTNDAVREFMSTDTYGKMSMQERSDAVADLISETMKECKREWVASKTDISAGNEFDLIREASDFDSADDFKGLPGKKYVEYNYIKYELSPALEAEYSMAESEVRKGIYTDINSNKPVNNVIPELQKKYYYAKDANGKKKRAYFNKPYSEYDAEGVAKIDERIDDIIKERVESQLKDKITSESKAYYEIDAQIESNIKLGDYSKNKWVRRENK